jgi:hypothetical protein
MSTFKFYLKILSTAIQQNFSHFALYLIFPHPLQLLYFVFIASKWFAKVIQSVRGSLAGCRKCDAFDPSQLKGLALD